MPVTRVCTNQTYAKSRVCPPLAGDKTREPGLFPGTGREGCELREAPLRAHARVRFATWRSWCRCGGAGGSRDEVQGIVAHTPAQRQLRRLLLPPENALRAGAGRAGPDV